MIKRIIFFTLFSVNCAFVMGNKSDEAAMRIMASDDVVFTDNELIIEQGFGPDVVGRCRGILNIKLIRDEKKKIEKVKDLLRDSNNDKKIMRLLCLAGLGNVLELIREMDKKKSEQKLFCPQYTIEAKNPKQKPKKPSKEIPGVEEDLLPFFEDFI